MQGMLQIGRDPSMLVPIEQGAEAHAVRRSKKMKESIGLYSNMQAV